jgi:hypothetical protein
MAFSSVQRALIYTLAYSHQWQWPLLFSELHERLVAKVSATGDDFGLPSSRSSSSEILSALQELQQQGIVTTQHKLWVLTGFEPSFEHRLSREKIAPHKWQEVQVFLSKVSKISWIQAVYVTGALAVNNVDAQDDVDFMIVTVPQRLWLSRVAVAWIALLAGKRRTWNGFEPNSWCFNLWLTTDELGCFRHRQSLYTAYELHQMQCVYDVANVDQRLRAQNAWVKQYLPNTSALDVSQPQSRLVEVETTSSSTHSFYAKLLNWLNLIAYTLQRWYMHPHQTREEVTLARVFFHPRDTSSVVYKGWVKVLQSLADSL